MPGSRKGVLAALATAALILGTTAATAPASAAVSPMTSWLGACHPWNDSRTAGGWCDGNGPTYQYQVVATCTKPGTFGSVVTYANGPRRWAGDQRQSYAYCSTTGAWLWQGWIYVYYGSNIVMTVWIGGYYGPPPP